MRSVLFLADWQNWAGSRVGLEMEALSQAGYQVDLLAWKRDTHDLNPSHEWNSVKIHPVSLSGSRSLLTGFLKLWPLHRLFLKEAWKIGKAFDIIHCTHPLFLPVAFRLAKTFRAKIIYDAFELHSIDFSERLPFGKRISRRFFEAIENKAVQKVDFILTVDTANNFLAQRYRQYNKNVELISNYPNLVFDASNALTAAYLEKYKKNKIVVYIGGIMLRKGLMVTLEALNQIRKIIPEIKLLLIGSHFDGEALAENYIREFNLEQNVEFLGWLQYEQLLSLLKVAKLGLALYLPEKHNLACASGGSRKTFDYMKASLPIVGSNIGEICAVIKKEDCGILVDPKNPKEVEEAILYLLKQPAEAIEMGKRGRKAIEEKYNWNIEKEKLLKAYTICLSNR